MWKVICTIVANEFLPADKRRLVKEIVGLTRGQEK